MVGTLCFVFILCDETKHVLSVVVLLNACVALAEHIIVVIFFIKLTYVTSIIDFAVLFKEICIPVVQLGCNFSAHPFILKINLVIISG